MKVDNFRKISNLLEYMPGQFYFIQVIRRRKDQVDKTQHRDRTVIASFYVDSEEAYERYEPTIKKLCQMNKARAYINLGRRDYEECALSMNLELGIRLKNRQYDSLKGLYESAVGKAKGRGPCWVIDIDSKDWTIVDFIANSIDKCDRNAELNSAVVTYIPTLNGYHLITHPFNRKQFEPTQVMHDIDLHTNSPTLLYLDFES